MIEDLIHELSKAPNQELHLIAGSTPYFKICGRIKAHGDKKLSKDEIETFLRSALSSKNFNDLISNRYTISAYSLPGLGRFSICAFMQRNSMCAVLKTISGRIDLLELSIPNQILDLNFNSRGLTIISSASCREEIAMSLISKLNNFSQKYILTAEKLCKYPLRNNLSVICQREANTDFFNLYDPINVAEASLPDVFFIDIGSDYSYIKDILPLVSMGIHVIVGIVGFGFESSISSIMNSAPGESLKYVKTELFRSLVNFISEDIYRKSGEQIHLYEFLTSNDFSHFANPDLTNYGEVKASILKNSQISFSFEDYANANKTNLGLTEADIAQIRNL